MTQRSVGNYKREGEQVKKSESLWLILKGTVDFREKWQLVLRKYAQGTRPTTTPHQAFTFSSFSHRSNHNPTKIFKFIYSSCPRASLQGISSKTNSLPNWSQVVIGSRDALEHSVHSSRRADQQQIRLNKNRMSAPKQIHSPSQWFLMGNDPPPTTTRGYLEIFLVVTLESNMGAGCYWYLVGRAQGCC